MPRILPASGTASRRRWICTPWSRRFFRPGRPTADIGCGSGREVAWLSAHGFPAVVGYDPSTGLLSQARARYPHLTFRHRGLAGAGRHPGWQPGQCAVRNRDHASRARRYLFIRRAPDGDPAARRRFVSELAGDRRCRPARRPRAALRGLRQGMRDPWARRGDDPCWTRKPSAPHRARPSTGSSPARTSHRRAPVAVYGPGNAIKPGLNWYIP